MHRLLSCALSAGVMLVLSGCAVTTVAGAVVGAAVSVTGAVVSTGVTVTGKAVGAVIDAASGSDKKAADEAETPGSAKTADGAEAEHDPTDEQPPTPPRSPRRR